MAKKDSGILVSPMYAPGVGHAQVSAPHIGEFPDPLGYLNPSAPAVGWDVVGGGDDINDWTAGSPPDGQSMGRR